MTNAFITQNVDEGEDVMLQCMSQGGRPTAEISWWDGDGNRIVSDIDEQVKRMEQGNTFKTISTLTFIPKESTHVQCSASNPIFPKSKRSATLQVKIKGLPNIDIREIKKGETFKVFCENPHISNKKKYRWTFNGNAIQQSSDLPHIVGPIKPGTKVPVVVMRKGKETQLKVTIGYVCPSLPGWLGLSEV